MEAVSLNLSRKWRSQNFDQLVGQDLSVRILKNSLYLGQFFPVYLFSGQKGCGKTSTARIFAMALNCARLSDFQKDPKNLSIPCLACDSCVAMQKGKHPDFIEIDAASHTGVDHMRTIIESSSLLPIMGQKRVYLIDEAHMLTKAAFNAALKILEEPPATALFILATTHPHKIIDTVRSRCFQLFFKPILHQPLKDHLEKICEKEAIAYDKDALDIIIRHTQGSARDALNLLEQVRFAHSVVNKQAVLQLLGHMSDQQVLDIVRATMQGEVSQLLDIFNSLIVEQYSADFMWQRLMTVLRALIWLKHGVNPRNFISLSYEILHTFAQKCSLVELHEVVESLYKREELFLKTPMQHALLEMILLNICYNKEKKKSGNDDGSAPCSLATGTLDAAPELEEDQEEEETESVISVEQKSSDFDFFSTWARFVELVVELNDPLLNSLFKQARFIDYDVSSQTIIVEFAKDLVFFKDWLEGARHAWQPLLQRLFFNNVNLQAQFSGASVPVEKVSPKPAVKQPEKVAVTATQSAPVSSGYPAKEKFNAAQQQYKRKVTPIQQKNEKVVDVSDQNQWKTASMLLKHFPGVITEIREYR